MRDKRALVAAMIALATAACTKEPSVQAKKEPAPVAVQTAPVRTKEIRRSVESVGTLYPFDETIVSAEIEGRMAEVRVDLGDRVAKGQVLARISDEEQRYLVQQNEAQLRMALDRVGLQSENDKVRDVREIPEVRRAQADLTDAEQQHKRIRSLVEQGIGSRSELDAAQSRLKAMQAGYDQSVTSARNLLQDIQRQKAALELQRKKLRDTTVEAPFDASVKERQITEGQYVRPDTPLFRLVKTDPLRLRLEVPERMAPWVKAGQLATVHVEAFADRAFTGKVWRVSPTVDETKRTFVVEALVQNPGNILKAGSYARASLPTDKADEVRLVPAQAVVYVLGNNKAYVVNEGRINARDVKLGERFADQLEILEGLEPGEQVAVTELNRLDEGTRVRVDSVPQDVSERRTASDE